MKMKKGNAGLIAVCLLFSMLIAVIFTGCGAGTGEQASPGKDGSAKDAVAEVPDDTDKVQLPAEPKEGQSPDAEEPSADGDNGQPAESGTPSADSEGGQSADAGGTPAGSAGGSAQEDESGVKVPDVNIVKKPVPDNEALSFVKNMKVGWNLGNTFDAIDATWLSNKLDYESAWSGVKTTPEMIKAVKDAGFNTIRIPVSWHNHVSGDDHKIDEDWLNRVQEVVDYAVANNLYIIINIHHDMSKEYIYPTSEYLDQSKHYVRSIWSQVAARFKDYDHHLVFESMNEPRMVGHKNEWWPDPNDKDCRDAVAAINELNQVFVDTVRSIGGNNAERYLMVPGYCASFAGALDSGFRLPADTVDNRLIVSVHAYTPYNFALQDGGVRTFDINRHASTNEIDYFMDRLYDGFISRGIPVVIGEFGARNKKDNLQDRVNFTAYYVASATARGMTCIWWDNNAFTGTGELFGIFNRRTVRWDYPGIVEALMKYAQ
jgi:endoglucanase